MNKPTGAPIVKKTRQFFLILDTDNLSASDSSWYDVILEILIHLQHAPFKKPFTPYLTFVASSLLLLATDQR